MIEIASNRARARRTPSRAPFRSGPRSGLSILETALALPLFLLMLFGIFDIGRLISTRMALQHAVREGGRFAVTGRKLPAQSGSPRVESIIQTVVDSSQPFVTLDSAQVLVSSASGGSGTGGGPGDVVTISVTHSVDLITPLVGQFFPNGQYVFQVASVFKNEPFPPGFAN